MGLCKAVASDGEARTPLPLPPPSSLPRQTPPLRITLRLPAAEETSKTPPPPPPAAASRLSPQGATVLLEVECSGAPDLRSAQQARPPARRQLPFPLLA